MSVSGGQAYVKGLRVDAKNRDPHDFYPTNPVATRALLAVEQFERTPLARIYTFSRRVPMARGRLAGVKDKTGQLAFAWFVWEHGFQGDPTTHFIDWKDA